MRIPNAEIKMIMEEYLSGLKTKSLEERLGGGEAALKAPKGIGIQGGYLWSWCKKLDMQKRFKERG